MSSLSERVQQAMREIFAKQEAEEVEKRNAKSASEARWASELAHRDQNPYRKRATNIATSREFLNYVKAAYKTLSPKQNSKLSYIDNYYSEDEGILQIQPRIDYDPTRFYIQWNTNGVKIIVDDSVQDEHHVVGKRLELTLEQFYDHIAMLIAKRRTKYY